MKRSILLSLMIIGAAVSLVVGASTFAAFSDSDTETGDVTAGTLTIEVDGTGLGGVLDFEPGSLLCPDEMSPGDTCEATVNVTNNGTVYGEIASVDVTVVSNTVGCADGNWSGGDDAIIGTQINPGATVSFTATVTLDAGALNECQDASATATVDSIPTPP